MSISQLYSYCQTESHSQQTIVALSNRTILLALHLLDNGDKITAKIAAQLIQCWAAVVRAAFADKIAPIGRFVEMIMDPIKVNRYEPETVKLLLLAGSSLFLLPYPNTPVQEQKWEERRSHFQKLCFTHSKNLAFLSSTCHLVYSESLQCRDAAAHGLRPIINECIKESVFGFFFLKIGIF